MWARTRSRFPNPQHFWSPSPKNFQLRSHAQACPHGLAGALPKIEATPGGPKIFEGFAVRP
jgi:hypothetical protein